MLGATLSCAAIFLGVKAVEYSHKWGLGLFPGKFYRPQLDPPVHTDNNYLMMLCIPPAIFFVLFLVYYIYSLIIASKFHTRVAGPCLVAAICYFGGVGLGTILEAEESHGDHAAAHGVPSHSGGHTQHADHTEHASHDGPVAEASADKPKLSLVSINKEPIHDVFTTVTEDVTPVSRVNQSAMAGLFFGIYYCMTGVHAVHILGGMLVITWLIIKAARLEFHSQYFGPVDNVGLYWHLVDFIWIYLFPLLYLIT
jgi:cytochrome c oxidase subunit III